MSTAESNDQPTTPPSDSDLIDIDHFAKLKLRVAQIESAEAVPKSKKLVRLELNLGAELGKRQIVAGIGQAYTPEQLVGRKIVIVANLKPAMLMGVESQGMLLAASTTDGLALVQPGKDSEVGSMPLGATVR